MKAVIYTNHTNTTQMRRDIPVIQDIYEAVGDTITIDIVKVNLIPTITQGEVDWQWFEETLNYGDYDTVVFDMRAYQIPLWSIKGAVAMYRQNGTDVHEFWMAHDYARRIGKWSDRYPEVSEFVYLFCHELLHGEARADGIPDQVHERAAAGTMFELFAEHGLRRKKLTVIASLLEQVRLLTSKLFNMKPALPIPASSWSQVTQEYLVRDRVNYPRTGVHPGVDFRGKIGDPVIAPLDGKITNSGYSRTLGNWLEYKFGDVYLIALHLKIKPLRGSFKKGDQIGVLGDTGLILGVHYHLEGWRQPMNRSLLQSEADVHKYTFDIRTKIA